MKNLLEYIIHFFVMAICLGALLFLFDLCTDERKELLHYLFAGLVFGVLSTIAKYLEDKGWNSWKKLFGLFRRDK